MPTPQPINPKPKRPVPPQLTPFKKGQGGKPPGARAKIDVRIKEAVESALVLSGEDGNGKNGAAGYFKWLSRAEPAVFGRIVEKILPHQVTAKIDDKRSMTLGEAVEELKERDLPVPDSLIEFNPNDYRVVSEKSAEVVTNDIEKFEAEGDQLLDERQEAAESAPRKPKKAATMTEKEYYTDVLAFFAMDNDSQPHQSRARMEQLQIGARLAARFLHNIETIARSQAILAGIEKRPGFLNGAGTERTSP